MVTDLGYKHWDLLFKISSLSACKSESAIVLAIAAKQYCMYYMYIPILVCIDIPGSVLQCFECGNAIEIHNELMCVPRTATE